MALAPFCVFQRGRSPIVAAAIHDGHDTRPSIQRRLALTESERLHEEDPCTAEWTQIAKTQIVGTRSRFEVDLNRPREHAVYETPAEAWGLDVWNTPPDRRMIDASLREYDQFYQGTERLLRQLVREHGHVAVYDLHTYNDRRDGPLGERAESATNPEVNVGTGTMDRKFWAPVVDRFINDLRAFDFEGRHLDVRENVRFLGGHFGKWLHQTFPRQVCSIAIEIRKFFMDEWTGEANADELEEIYLALQATLPGVVEELKRL